LPPVLVRLSARMASGYPTSSVQPPSFAKSLAWAQFPVSILMPHKVSSETAAAFKRRRANNVTSHANPVTLNLGPKKFSATPLLLG
jgi:hypothetical protein